MMTYLEERSHERCGQSISVSTCTNRRRAYTRSRFRSTAPSAPSTATGGESRRIAKRLQLWRWRRRWRQPATMTITAGTPGSLPKRVLPEEHLVRDCPLRRATNAPHFHCSDDANDRRTLFVRTAFARDTESATRSPIQSVR